MRHSQTDDRRGCREAFLDHFCLVCGDVCDSSISSRRWSAALDGIQFEKRLLRMVDCVGNHESRIAVAPVAMVR